MAGSKAWHQSAHFEHIGFSAKHATDRALLMQTSATFGKLLGANLNLPEPLTETLKPGAFGENIFVDSSDFHSGTLCIGDVLGCRRGAEELQLRLQVSSPRCPCCKVDQKFGKKYTIDGVRCHCASTGCAGIFLRVLVPGDLMEADVLRLVARPNPSWSLERVSGLLYAHPTTLMHYAQRANKASHDKLTDVVLRSEWMGSKEELQELADLPELGVCEYKEHLWKLLGRRGIGRYQTPSYLNDPIRFLTGSGAVLLVCGALILVRGRMKNG